MSQEVLKKKISELNPVIIELGCGPNNQSGVIGIDIFAFDGVDYVADLEKGIPFLDDNSVDMIRSRHLLEHIENFEFLMKEIHRVLKPGGKKIAIVPHFSNPYYYSDYTHKRFFGLYTFDYFSTPDTGVKRKVPPFYVDFRYKVVERKLIFKSPGFMFRHFFKNRIVQPLVNMNSYFQELYEEVFCHIVPCQEIEFVLIPDK